MWRLVQITVLLMALAGGLVLGCGERPGEREFENALRQFERDRLIRARDLFEKSVNKRPGHEANAVALHYLGYIAWTLGDTSSATAYFENSRRLNPHLFEPVFSLAALAYEANDWPQARALFDEAEQLRPRDPRPLEFKARMLTGPEQRREARRLLFEALARSPHSPRILTSLALVELEDSGPTAAVSYLMQALEKDPNYAPALFNLGKVYARWDGHTDQAEAYFNEFLQVAAPGDPQRERALHALAVLHGDREPEPETEAADIITPTDETPPAAPKTFEDFLAEAKAMADEGRVAQAVGFAMRLAAQARQEQQVEREEQALLAAKTFAPESATVHLALGRHWAARDRHDEARRAFQQALDIEPDWSQALIGLANSARTLGDYDVALDALSRAVSLEEHDPEPLWSLASLYEVAGINRLALERYRQFRDRFPNDPRSADAGDRIFALTPPPPVEEEPPPPEPPVAPTPTVNPAAAIDAFNRGATYQQRRDWDNALFFYERAIKNDPSFERAFYNTGVIQLERRNLFEAREAFSRSVELAPDKITALYNLALTHYELGEAEQALPLLDRILRMDTNFAPAHLLAGVIHAANPRTLDRARRHYTRFLQLRPNDPSASAVRSWLAANP